MGESTGRMGLFEESDIEGKTAREAASELGNERVSNGRERMSQFQSKQPRRAHMVRQTERQGSKMFGASKNLANSLLAPSCLSYGANHLRSRTLALADARAAMVLKASRRRYPAGIRVNHVIVLDERY